MEEEKEEEEKVEEALQSVDGDSLRVCVCAGIGDVLKLIKGHGWARHGTERDALTMGRGRGGKRRGAGQGSARAALASAAHLCEEGNSLLPPACRH